MDISFMIESIPKYLDAMFLTLRLGWGGIVFSVLLGFICCLISYYKVPVLKQFIAVYTELSRNTPLLIQLFFLYYGLPKVGIVYSGDTCAIIGLTFLGGSYMSEAFRGGIEAVRKSQLETGMSLGMSKIQIACYVIFPQMMAVSAPSLGANCLFLLKETSVFSVIAIMDLMNVTKEMIGLYYNTSESLLMLVIFYLIILLPLSGMFTYMERRLRYAESGA